MSTLANRGPITLSPDKTYLQYADKTPFFWFADTWWYGGTKRSSLEEFKTLVNDRKVKGFTVVQFVVGIPPETDPFSDDGANSGGLPFNKDLSINTQYFDAIDRKIHILIENDLVPCIVGGWGHHIDILGIEPIKRLWDEIIKRYSHLPVIFCLCGEANLLMPPVPQFFQKETRRKTLIKLLQQYKLFSFARKIKQKIEHQYYQKKQKQLLQERIKKWNHIAEYITKKDIHHRLLTVHVAAKTTAQQLFHNPDWLSLNTLQSGHGKDTLPFMVTTIRNADKNKQPIINMEPWYEGIFGNFDAYYQRVAFWMCLLSGAKGHTYGAHGIWQMATKNDHFMNHWGESDWKKAIQFKGAEQLGNAVKFLKNYDWWKITPVDNLVTPAWSTDTPWLPVSAVIKDSFFIYIPDTNNINTYLTINRNLSDKKISGFQPDTMKEINLTKKGNEILIPNRQTKDLLIIASKK